MIEIRTLDELRAGRTVIQITVGSEQGDDLSPEQAERAGMGLALEKRVIELSEELAATQDRAGELERTLATARLAEDSRLRERDDRIKALENRVEAFRHGWNRTEEELQVARASEVSAARLAECNGKIESLETKLGLAHADRANLKREVTRLEGELDAASRLAQSADTRRATAELRAEQAHQRTEQLAAELDAATGHLLLRDGELVSANDQRDNWRAAAEQLKTELVIVKGERDSERNRADHNREWAERAEGDRATARESLKRTRGELATSNDNFQISQRRVETLTRVISEMESEGRRALVDEARERQADPGVRLYTAAEVGDAQTSEAELVTAPLNARILAQDAQIDSLRITLTAAGVSTALTQVTPGTPGDVLARAVRLARMTLNVKH